jgi:hypothetical protein
MQTFQNPAEELSTLSGVVIADWNTAQPQSEWRVYGVVHGQNGPVGYHCVTTGVTGRFDVSLPSTALSGDYVPVEFVLVSPSGQQKFHGFESWMAQNDIVFGVTGPTYPCESHGVASIADVSDLSSFSTSTVAGTISLPDSTPAAGAWVDVVREAHSHSYVCADAAADGDYSVVIPTEWIGTAIFMTVDGESGSMAEYSMRVPAPNNGVSTISPTLKSAASNDLGVGVSVLDSAQNQLVGIQNVRYSVCLHAGDPEPPTFSPAVACGRGFPFTGLTGAVGFDLSGLGQVVPTYATVFASTNSGGGYASAPLPQRPQSGPWQTLVTVNVSGGDGGTPPLEFSPANCPASPTVEQVAANTEVFHISGYALGPDGDDQDATPDALSGAQVSVAPAAGGAGTCVASGADGYFALPIPGAGLYTVTIDPPAGRTDIGSVGYRVTSSGTSPATQSKTLYAPEFAGTLNVYGADQLDPMRSAICLANPQTQAIASCGRVHDRGESGMGWSLSVAPGTDLSSYGLYYAYLYDTGNIFGFEQPLPTNNKLDLFLELSNQGGGDGGVPNYECSNTDTPVVSGVVTAGGQPYANTFVQIRIAGDTNSPPPAGWSSDDVGVRVPVGDDGSYAVCNFEPWGLGFHVIAESKERGAAASIGDTASSFQVRSPGAAYANVNVSMQSPTVRGNSSGASEILVNSLDQWGNARDYARVTLDDDGDFAAALPFVVAGDEWTGRYRILATDDFGSGELVPVRLGGDFTASVGDAVRTFTGSGPMTPNIRGTIRDIGGSPLSSNPRVWAGVEVQRVDDDCPQGGDRTVLNASGCFVEVGRSAHDRFSLAVPDGTYSLTTYASSRPTTTAVFSVAGSTITTTSSNVTLPSAQTEGRLLVDFSAGDIQFRIVDSAGTEVTGGQAWAELWNGVWFNYVSSQPFGEEGPFSWAPSQDGKYQIRLTPPSSRPDLAETRVYVEVTTVNGRKAITNLCSWSANSQSAPVCNLPVVSNAGIVDLTVESANTIISVCGEAVDGCPSVAVQRLGWLAKPEIDVREMIFGENGYMQSSRHLFRMEVDNTPRAFRLEEMSGGQVVYEIVVYPPYGNPDLLASERIFILVDQDGVDGDDGWFRCTGTSSNGSNPCAGGNRGAQIQPVDGVHSLGAVVLGESAFIGTVKRPNGSPVSQSWVSIQREVPCDWDATRDCLDTVAQQESNLNGQFPLDVSAGDYVIRANVPWNDSSDLSPGTLRVTFTDPNSDGNLVASTLLDVYLAEPNVSGRVLAGGQPRPWVGVGVEKQVVFGSSIEWQWTTEYTNTDRQGRYRINLGEGIWRVTSWPQGEDQEIFTRAETIVEIDADGAVTTVNGEEYTEGSAIDLAYGTPNLAGTVSDSDGDPVAWSGIGVERWNDASNPWSHVAWTNTNANGIYALNVSRSSGSNEWFRLTVHPSGGDAIRTVRYIFSSADGEAFCFVANRGSTACSSPNFDVTLDGPNVQGVVLGDSGSGPVGRGAWVNARKWNPNSQWFDWIDSWTEARQGTGNFGLLLDNGDYEIFAEPRVGSGFAKTARYLRVSDNGICEFTVADGAPQQDCSSITLVNGRIPIELVGSNLVGAATFVSGENSGPLTEGWVEVFDIVIDGEFESKQWRDSAGINRQGSFALRVDTAAGTSRLIELVVSPSNWNPQISALGLSRAKVRILVTNDGTSTTLCRAAQDGETCLPNSAIAPGTPIGVQLNTGNLAGQVVLPGNCSPSCAVVDSQIQIQKWESSGSYWQWINEWANTGSAGGFSMQLDPGVYRVTARPPYGNTSTAPGQALIKVEAGGWCSVDSVGDTCAGYGTTLVVALATPNLAGVVQSSGSGVGNAWVAVEKSMAGGYWQWTDNGTSTSSREDSLGAFSLNVTEDGTYRIVVDPPWNAGEGTAYVRFTREFNVSGGVVTWSGNGGSNISSFPTPNLTFTVTDGTSGVRDAWVYAEKLVNGSNWQWADVYGGTRGGGRVSLILPAAASGQTDTYRLTINAPWNRAELPRFTRTVTVDDAGVVVWSTVGEVTAGVVSTQFPSSNVSGRIEVSAGVANRWAWIEVYNGDGSQWLEGTNLNQAGSFALFLADTDSSDALPTTYRLRAHPNYSITSGLPIDLEVHVTDSGSGSVLTGWNYVGDATSRCSSSPCTIAARLDFVPPNVTISVEFSEGGAAAGAFVRLRQCADGETAGACTGATVTLVTDSQGVASARLANGTYDLAVTALSGGSVRRSAAQLITASDTATSLQVSIP